MSALHAAVARAIAEVYRGTGGMASGGTYGDLLADRAAASAIRVVVAEAERAIDPLTPGTGSVLYDEGFNDALEDVLDVLAELGAAA